MATKLRLTICGGGNGAHTFAGIAASMGDTDVTVLNVYQTNAEIWTSAMVDAGFTVSFSATGKVLHHERGQPFRVCKKLPDSLGLSDIVVFCLPAYAHQEYLQLIAPVVKDSCIIVGMPGHFGFELECLKILQENNKRCTVMTVESLPWVCRISKYGNKVTVSLVKELVDVFIAKRSKDSMDPQETLQYLLGEKPVITGKLSFLEMSLVTMAILHPPMMYSAWREWKGETLSKPPLFYQGATERCVRILMGVSEDIWAICKEFEKRAPGLDLSKVKPIRQWLVEHHGNRIKDKSTLLSVLRTNKAYDGLVHPTKQLEDGTFIPDFAFRYLSEDIPFGLVGIRSLADIACVKTPTVDVLIEWAQNKLDKEYLVNSQLLGKDIGETRVVQRYGYTTVEQLKALNSC